ncbi:hypothetical protein [Lacticaseibacillus sp. N501-2]|uniref:hypothetical protein n=1 Tax=Lacticaseibacillus salsurae TaxID=3367729 RepID=UPI0038B40CD0
MRIRTWGMLALFTCLGLWTCPLHPSHAATPSVIPPTGFQDGFHQISPTTGVSTYFKIQPTWYRMSNVGAPVTGWTIVRAGEDMQLRASVAKTGWDFIRTASLSINVQKATGAVDNFSGDWSADPAILAQAAEYGLVYQTGKYPSGAVNNDDIRYEMKIPQVTQPTWYTLQINVNLTFLGDPLRTVSSNLARILVVPTNYAPTLTPSESVLFKGQSTNLAVDGLDNSIVPNYQFTSNPALTTQLSGNGLQVTANGQVSSTPIQAQIQFAPMFGGDAPINVVSSPAIVDTANLADVTVTENQPATFNLQLPPGLTATNTRWYVGGVLQPTSANGSLGIPSTKIGADVYAISDFKRGDTIVAQNVRSNTAKLNVTQGFNFEFYDMDFNAPFLFTSGGPQSPKAPTTSLKATVLALPASASAIVWHAYQPGTQTPSDLVKISADGTVTAGPDAGTVDIEVNFTTAGGPQVTGRRLTIIKLADGSANAFDHALFQAPALPAGQLVNAAWYFADTAGQLPDQPAVSSSALTASGPVVTSADNDRHYQVVMQVDADGQTYTLNSNVANFAVIPPAGLALQAVPSFYFANDAAGVITSPTVSALISGSTQLPSVNGPQPLIVSDRRDEAGPWQLQVQMPDFQATATQTPLGANGGSVVMAFQGAQAPARLPVTIGATATTIADIQAPLAIWETTATLNLPPIPAPLAGSFAAPIQWTLAAAPTPAAP